MTLEIVVECLGMQEDKAIYAYFKEHYADWFPGLQRRANFIRQCANLLGVKPVAAGGIVC